MWKHVGKVKEELINQLYLRMHHFYNFKQVLNTEVGICSVVGHDRVLMLIHTIASLFYFLKTNYSLYLVDDGTLTESDKMKINRIFTVKIQSPDEGKSKIINKFGTNSKFVKYRLDKNNSLTRLKFDAYILNSFKRAIYIDSDVLIFNEPKEISKWLKQDSQNILCMLHDRKLFKSNLRQDLDHSIRVLLSNNGFPQLSPSFNSGLIALSNKDIFNAQLLDSIFNQFIGIGYDKAFTAEETALSIVLKNSNSSITFLPKKKYLCPARMSELSIALKMKKVAIHFISETKREYPKHLMRLLFSNNLFLSVKSQLK